MVDQEATPEFITSAAIQICQKHGIAKAIEFLHECTNGLNIVETFAVCEDKARLKKDSQGKIYVEWREDCESQSNSTNSSDTKEAT